MMILPIKKKWFDMILSGEKKEEYREIKPYYIKRLTNIFKVSETLLFTWFQQGSHQNLEIMFRNGYSSHSPSFVADCELYVGKGNVDWGAVLDTEYIIFKIKKIRRRSEI
ncbi:ASCH domain-containing protein [Anaerocolumna sedimenticola]|uniref:ASCH domain-containing protein n=1 Tax=Anaerocolumna sedimenticola TaxID=2696063 RepID=A0A6P1TK56_9FIRM|nr:ASCH domain-containing protein [Anaerocolumna sedimenticola]QHQ60499.1 ASCH domain-containing protein [Anaerocolumna sedimenticola]